MLFSRKKHLIEDNNRLRSDNRQLRTENRDIRERLFQYWEVIYGAEKDLDKLKKRVEHYRSKSNCLIDENNRLTKNLRDVSEVARGVSTRKSRRHHSSRHHSGQPDKNKDKKKQVMIDNTPKIHYLNKEKIVNMRQHIDPQPTLKLVTPQNIPKKVLDSSDESSSSSASESEDSMS